MPSHLASILLVTLFATVFAGTTYKTSGAISLTTYSGLECTHPQWQSSEAYRLKKCTCGLNSCMRVVANSAVLASGYVVETFDTVDDCSGDASQTVPFWDEGSWGLLECNPFGSVNSYMYLSHNYYSSWGYAYSSNDADETDLYSATSHYIGPSCEGTIYSSLAIRNDPGCAAANMTIFGYGECVYDNVTGLSRLTLCGEQMWSSWDTTTVGIVLGVGLGIGLPAMIGCVITACCVVFCCFCKD